MNIFGIIDSNDWNQKMFNERFTERFGENITKFFLDKHLKKLCEIKFVFLNDILFSSLLPIKEL